MTVNGCQLAVTSGDNYSVVTSKLHQLESQLAELLEVKPKTFPERKKLEREAESLKQSVANIQAYLALGVGQQVTDSKKFGTISFKSLSPGGMPEIWVSWSGKSEVPEQPKRLTVIKPPPYAIADKPQLPQDAPAIASLFTGGGLFEAGAMAAGFRPIWGIEHDPDHPDFSRQIADVYEHNFGSHIIKKTVQEVAKGSFQALERPTVLHISQPCKSFSSANSKTESETDLSAARAVQQAIQELQPSVVTVENVVSYRDSQSWQLIRETLTHLGYSIKEAVVNAADYGVPQKRQRFLAYAVQGQKPPEFPEKMASSLGWLEAIADLIPTLPETQLADWQKERIPNPKSQIPNGKAYLIERTGARKDRDLLVRSSNEPSWTIKANIATDQKGANRHDPLNALLPDGKVVSLDARAIARLQSVPDWYELPEPIGVAVTLIGNGVPCLLAQRLMEALKPCLESQGLKESPIQNPKSKIQNPYVWLALDEIRRDGGTQPRVKMDSCHIKRLEEQIEEGQQLEPVVVFHDGESYWLADGFHRWQAHSNQEEEAIACTIHEGSRRDAILYSVGANADHKPALPRSRQDKRRAVLTLLQDPYWSTWSDREIARKTHTTHPFVSKIRANVTGNITSENQHPVTGNVTSEKQQTVTGNITSENQYRTYTTKHGTVATMKTANIGGTQKALSIQDGEQSESEYVPTPEVEAVEPQTIEVNTDEICLAFLSNLEYMSVSQLETVVEALAKYQPDLFK